MILVLIQFFFCRIYFTAVAFSRLLEEIEPKKLYAPLNISDYTLVVHKTLSDQFLYQYNSHENMIKTVDGEGERMSFIILLEPTSVILFILGKIIIKYVFIRLNFRKHLFIILFLFFL